MKNFSGAMLALVAVLAGVFPAHSAEFGGMDGKYKATVTAGVGSPVSGTATMKVSVPKSNESAAIKITGALVSGGESVPISGTLRFSGRKSFATSTLVFNLTPTGGAQGTFKQTGRITRFKAPWVFDGQTGKIEGTVSASRDGKKLKVLYTLTDSAQTFTYSFNFNGKRKGK